MLTKTILIIYSASDDGLVVNLKIKVNRGSIIPLPMIKKTLTTKFANQGLYLGYARLCSKN